MSRQVGKGREERRGEGWGGGGGGGIPIISCEQTLLICSRLPSACAHCWPASLSLLATCYPSLLSCIIVLTLHPLRFLPPPSPIAVPSLVITLLVVLFINLILGVSKHLRLRGGGRGGRFVDGAILLGEGTEKWRMEISYVSYERFRYYSSYDYELRCVESY